MISLSAVLRKISEDVNLDSFTRQYLQRRLRNEGPKFLTETLPKLSKVVLASIEAGYFLRKELNFTNFAWKGALLKVFSGLLSRIFDKDTGSLSQLRAVNAYGQLIVIQNHICPYSYPALTAPLTKEFTALNWDKLPTSTQVGIIQLLAELDDTLAIFTRKFWQQLSYGSFTWGVVPFVSDLKAVLDAISNLSVDLSSFSYEDSLTVPVNLTNSPFSYYDTGFNGFATVRKTGRADLSFLDEASVWLDRLGFHPDLATAWDLIPMSFLLDYILPIGDYLESLTGGGWVKAIRFNGWVTCKLQGTYTVRYHTAKLTGEYKAFQRWNGDSILITSDVGQPPALEMPSLRELFNLLYVIITRGRK